MTILEIATLKPSKLIYKELIHEHNIQRFIKDDFDNN